MELTITLTETEYNALSRVCADPQEWAQNAVKERARLAVEDIVAEQVRAMLDDPKVKTIPANVDKLVASAPEPEQFQNIVAEQEEISEEAPTEEESSPIS
jgi:hypothetical protein